MFFKKKINLGGGDWKKAGWHNIDFSGNDTTTIRLDFKNNPKFPFKDSSIKKAFSSHLIEHLSDDNVEWLFSETYKVLKKSAIFRLSFPNYEKAKESYIHNIGEYFYRAGITLSGNMLHIRFLNFIASFESNNYLGFDKYKGGPIIDKDQVDKNLKEMEDDLFIRWVVSNIPEDAYYVAHINAFTFDKIEGMLRKAGFRNIVLSEYRKSQDLEMRENLFDVRKDISMFVECSK
jgi:hypothetical protein